jgi:hypothetical protein
MYAFIALMPFIWRSRRKSFSNSADTPSIARCSWRSRRLRTERSMRHNQRVARTKKLHQRLKLAAALVAGAGSLLCPRDDRAGGQA